MSGKNAIRFIAVFVMMVALLAACGSTDSKEENTSQSDDQEQTIQITISKNEGEEIIDEKTVSIEEGAILIDVMDEHFELEKDFGGAFIVSIDGVGPEDGEEVSWMYSVNDEVAMVAVDEYELEFDDHVVFDLQPW